MTRCLTILFLLFASVLSAQDDTARLQSLCDAACRPGGTRVVDLRKQTLVIHHIVLNPRHDGLRLCNGTLVTLSDSATPNKRYGIIEIASGITLRGISYPEGELDLLFEDLVLAGLLVDYTDDFRVNQDRAKAQGVYCAGINVMNGSRPDSITATRIKVQGLFAGIQSLGTYRTVIHDSQFRGITGHSIVASVPPNNAREMTLDVYRCTSYDCGNLFDISAPDTTRGVVPPVVPRAWVRECKSLDTLGRNKIAGQWDVEIDRTELRQRRLIPNLFAGLSISQAQTVSVSNSLIEGFPAGGVWCRDGVTLPSLTLVDSTIRGGQIGINSTALTDVQSVTFDMCYLPWGASAPAIQSGVTITNPASVDNMATQFLKLRAIDPNWVIWIDKPIKNRMTELEQ